MSNTDLLNIIYEALGETYQKYGFIQVLGAVKSVIVSNNFSYFKSEGRAKLKNKLQELGENISPENTGINYTFFEGVLDCYIENLIKQGVPKTDLERNILATEERFKNHPRKRDIVRNQFISKAQLDMNSELLGRDFDSKGNIKEMLSRICEFHREEQKRKNVAGLQASNVQVHAPNMQRLREGIISGLTKYKSGSVNWGPLHACTSIGLNRENQEDAILIKQHPQNSKFKLLAVSDGMGGIENGEQASDYTVTEISNWFQNIPAVYYKAPVELSKSFEDELRRISKDIEGRYHGNAGATFVGAIVCEDETIITNIGDSRAYTYTRSTNQLVQQSEDHSLVEKFFRDGLIERRDDMRFHKRANSIIQSIGMVEEYGRKFEPNTWLVENSDYDQLILISDGVSDCLSDDDILVITKKTPKDKIAEMLVAKALNTTSIARPELPRDIYYDKITPGKDNTSAVTFDNER